MPNRKEVKGIDFSSSSAIWLTHDDSIGRFSIESVCDIFDSKDNLIDTFCLLSAVIACNVYGKGDLIYEPSFLYQVVFSMNGEYKMFRTHARFDKEADNYGKNNERFKNVTLNIIRKEIVSNNNDDDLLDLIKSDISFNGYTILGASSSNGYCILHYPIKHINFQPAKKVFQVETGQVLMPIDEAFSEVKIDKLNIVYLAYNCKNVLEYIPYVSESFFLNWSVRFYKGRNTVDSRNHIYTLN